MLAGCGGPTVFQGTVSPIAGHVPAPTQVVQETPEAPAEQVQAIVGVDASLSQSAFVADEGASFVARVRIDPEALEGLPKPPVSVALVLDTSGSMAGEPLEKAKAAALEFVDALGDDDRVALVVFHSIVETPVALRTLADGGREAVREAIAGLQATGTTELATGLATGLAQVRQGLSQGAARVVLLSDGRPNDGAPIFPTVDQAAAQGITVTALGLGLEYDEDLLGKIAQKTGGKFHFAESPDQVAQLFRDEVLALQRIVGRGAHMRIAPGPGVKIERVLGPAHSDGRTGFLIQVGDLVELEERDVFVLLQSEGHRAGANIEVLDVHLTFQDALSQQARVERAFVSARAIESADAIERDAEVELGTARALAADDALAAMALARGGELREAKKRAALAIARAKRDAVRFDDDLLRRRVEQLGDLKEALPGLVPPRAPRMAGGRPRPATEPRPAPVGGGLAKRSHASAMADLGY